MAISGRQLSILTVGFWLHFSYQYSFQNCIGVPYSNNQSFQCYRRKESNLLKFVDDLPASAVSITISVNPISHIPTGSFQRFGKLENLNLDRNKLKFIDGLAFRNLHHLKSLNLSINAISKLNCSVFQDLDNLTFLTLENNSLSDLPESLFLNTPNLDTLILRHNHLDNFSVVARSVTSLHNLTKLDICFNNLTSLSNFNNVLPKSLTTMYVCGNKLSMLACSGSFLMYVRLLDLSYNFELSAAAFKGVNLAQIRHLRMRLTKVKILEFFNVSNVNARYVDLSGMGLNDTSMIDNLCKLIRQSGEHIKNIKLENNSISLHHLALSNCPQITETLEISTNNLTSLQCFDFLKGQKLIQTLNVEHNHMTTLLPCNNATKLPIKKLSFRYNRILSVRMHAFAHMPNVTVLQLNINIIAFLHREALRGLTKLQTLRLDNNLLSDLYEETFHDLTSLKVLNLRNNRIAVIFNSTFLHLSQLTKLDLGGNKITHFETGGLDGLKSLLNLYLDGNKMKQIESSHFTAFQNILQVLDLQGNQIQFITETTTSPFVHLSNLRDLKLSDQQPYGISFLPHGFFRGLHSLNTLYLSNNRIVHLAADVFDDLTDLHFLTLDNSCSGVVQLKPGLFKNLRNLTKLSVENMGIANVSKDVFGNLTQLQSLQLNNNAMQHIEVDVLNALPCLEYLDIRQIPLRCSCENRALQLWTLNNPNVQLIYLHSLSCQESKDNFYDFDTAVCDIDLEKCFFSVSAAVIFVFSVVPLLWVKLYWKFKYGYYVFRAWFSEQWHTLREDEENCEYSAFISYNFHDEEWVLEQLLPNLEGNGSSLKLCLHHRDFEPGRNIVDNIVSAVYGSRKTVCVVSRKFLQSEWCSLELQLANYRLFDEHRDVLLLVFLEHIPERELSPYHRMRKVMLKKTYLQWPGSKCTDPARAQQLFWNQLRRALTTSSRMEDEEEPSEKESSKRTPDGVQIAD